MWVSGVSEVILMRLGRKGEETLNIQLNRNEMSEFIDFIEDLELVDVLVVGSKFT